MIHPADSRQADGGGQTICADHHEFLVLVLVGEDCRERKRGCCVAGRKRAPTAPESTLSVDLVGRSRLRLSSVRKSPGACADSLASQLSRSVSFAFFVVPIP
jgi:hypothetical protein